MWANEGPRMSLLLERSHPEHSRRVAARPIGGNFGSDASVGIGSQWFGIERGGRAMAKTFAYALAVLAVALTTANAQPRNLEIYWVDVEGGAATLLVAPSGESLLFDAGFETPDNRDSRRIVAAAQHAGLKKIDYFVLSHYHADHAGGLQELAKLMPIGRCFDRGDFIEPMNQRWRDAYLSVCADK